MRAWLVLPVLVLVSPSSLALQHSCGSGEMCMERRECKYYQDSVKQITLEKSYQRRKELILKLRSMVCDRRKKFVCCPFNKQKLMKVDISKESPTYLPRQGECGHVEEHPTPLVGTLGYKHKNNECLYFRYLVVLTL